MERIAECHCGQLRAITSGEPDSVYVCHCKACQRRTGAIIRNGSRWLKRGPDTTSNPRRLTIDPCNKVREKTILPFGRHTFALR
jgi:hypothetical protein